ncbi:MAG: hypothetical protein L3J74_13870 [Bacteroidales bacterium]|nr:hypothetical protein [Bacteroidales bacterium]
MMLNNNHLEKIYNDIDKNYFIVKDNYQPLIDLNLKFQVLSGLKNNSLNNRKTMDILITKTLEEISLSINKPKLIDCNELETYLKGKE